MKESSVAPRWHSQIKKYSPDPGASAYSRASGEQALLEELSKICLSISESIADSDGKPTCNVNQFFDTSRKVDARRARK